MAYVNQDTFALATLISIWHVNTLSRTQFWNIDLANQASDSLKSKGTGRYNVSSIQRQGGFIQSRDLDDSANIWVQPQCQRVMVTESSHVSVALQQIYISINRQMPLKKQCWDTRGCQSCNNHLLWIGCVRVQEPAFLLSSPSAAEPGSRARGGSPFLLPPQNLQGGFHGSQGGMWGLSTPLAPPLLAL